MGRGCPPHILARPWSAVINGIVAVPLHDNVRRPDQGGFWMLGQVIARLRKVLVKPKVGHSLHAPFRVTTQRGHTVQTFQSLEMALEAAEALGPDHFVIDRHGLQIWNPQRKLLRNEE